LDLPLSASTPCFSPCLDQEQEPFSTETREDPDLVGFHPDTSLNDFDNMQSNANANSDVNNGFSHISGRYFDIVHSGRDRLDSVSSNGSYGYDYNSSNESLSVMSESYPVEYSDRDHNYLPIDHSLVQPTPKENRIAKFVLTDDFIDSFIAEVALFLNY
jgi:hypothetical protein